MATYIKIASVTVGAGGAADITFSSIPATYDDLILHASVRSTGNTVSNVRMYFNNLTSNWTGVNIFGTGSTTGSNASGINSGIIGGTNYTASTFSSNTYYIPNYRGSTNKSTSLDGVTENDATESYQVLHAGLWSQTAAITSIKLDITTVGFNFAQYSTAVLYGISKT